MRFVIACRSRRVRDGSGTDVRVESSAYEIGEFRGTCWAILKRFIVCRVTRFRGCEERLVSNFLMD
jgi:hypothetical protein